MDGINYFREYLQSKYHLWFGLATVGIGLISGSVLLLIIGFVLYGLGFMFLPDLPFFRNKIDHQYKKIKREQDLIVIEQFKEKRDKQIMSLTPSRKEKYWDIVKLCKEIENSTMEQISSEDAASDVRLRKLDELSFIYLKLLCNEQQIQLFLEAETREDIRVEIEKSKNSVARLTEEIATLSKDTNATPLIIESKQRLLVSYSDKLEVLKKRQDRIEQAKGNISLVEAEQSKLSEQIKLLRADVVASKNAEAISSRIDASVQNLDETNRWLSQVNEFKDVVGDVPQSDLRLGFGNIKKDDEIGSLKTMIEKIQSEPVDLERIKKTVRTRYRN